jgi:hypothetical protein
VLEVGAGNGFFGTQVAERYPRARIFITDARHEHVEGMAVIQPNSTKFVLDATDIEKYPNVDVILHFGLLYHLEDPITHLKKLRKNSWKLLLLETEVVNSSDKSVLYLEEEGYDQSVSRIGGRPSSRFVESIFSNIFRFQVRRFDDAQLNSGFHVYDWVSQNTRTSWKHGLRRFWAISKKN